MKSGITDTTDIVTNATNYNLQQKCLNVKDVS